MTITMLLRNTLEGGAQRAARARRRRGGERRRMSWDLFSAADASRARGLNARRATSRPGRVAGRRGPMGARRAAEPRRRAGGRSRGERRGARAGRGRLPALWVAGEVANFTRARSGHCYFTLRDEARSSAA
jgi:hypothetical protein